MRAGDLRHRITIMRPLDASETTQDSFGQDVGTPVAVGTFWCKVEALTGRELLAMQQRWAKAAYKITMRRQSAITFTAKMQATWSGKALNIVDVQDIGESMRPEVVLFAEDYNG